jgi:hypothetical protein
MCNWLKKIFGGCCCHKGKDCCHQGADCCKNDASSKPATENSVSAADTTKNEIKTE